MFTFHVSFFINTIVQILNNVESLTFNDELSERNTERSLIRYPLTTNRYMNHVEVLFNRADVVYY